MENKDNKIRKKGNRPKIDKRKLGIRIIAWILLVMMVVTALYTAIYFLIEQVSAQEPEDLNVAVGLLYGDSVDVAFTTRTTTGFTVGTETIEMYKKTFSPLWTLPNEAKVSVVGDRNYGRTATNSYYQSNTDVAVGGYQLQIDTNYTDKNSFSAAVSAVDAAIKNAGVYVIPSYINGNYKIRIGSYATDASASEAMKTLSPLLSGYTLSVAAPTSTGVTVVEHDTAKILFEYDCGTSSYLALEPIDNSDGTEAYLATPANNIYDGVFVYKRYITSKTDGISLTNVLPLDDYIMGVVPYEVSNSWPRECLKAMAVIARTYVISNMSKYWNSYGFNVDATTSSQVYKGVARANDNVITAVTETAGLVMTYNGSLAPVFYSSSTGNCNADVRYVWGGSTYPWLESVETPWEDYRNHSNAFWQAEVSPEQLQKSLYNKGYTTLTAPIASIDIDSYAGENSTYIYQLTVTDQKGNTAKITRSDKVRSAFSDYVKSSNFVVGKGSVNYVTYNKLLPPEVDTGTVNQEGDFTVLTNVGKYSSSFTTGVSVMTVNGTVSDYIPESGAAIITSKSNKYTLSADLPSHLEIKTAEASNQNNFIFVGKGWGHGVGYSQYGMYDLAVMGYDYSSILLAYCPSTATVSYKSVVNY